MIHHLISQATCLLLPRVTTGTSYNLRKLLLNRRAYFLCPYFPDQLCFLSEWSCFSAKRVWFQKYSLLSDLRCCSEYIGWSLPAARLLQQSTSLVFCLKKGFGNLITFSSSCSLYSLELSFKPGLSESKSLFVGFSLLVVIFFSVHILNHIVLPTGIS